MLEGDQSSKYEEKLKKDTIEPKKVKLMRKPKRAKIESKRAKLMRKSKRAKIGPKRVQIGFCNIGGTPMMVERTSVDARGLGRIWRRRSFSIFIHKAITSIHTQ